ncbi:hypothetical protein P9112_009781 [Eukaryota sp. TZLM1-RC]
MSLFLDIPIQTPPITSFYFHQSHLHHSTSFLFYGKRNGQVEINNLNSNQSIKYRFDFNSINTLSATDHIFVSGSRDGVVRIYKNLDESFENAGFYTHSGSITNVLFDNGNIISTATDGQLIAHDVTSQQLSDSHHVTSSIYSIYDLSNVFCCGCADGGIEFLDKRTFKPTSKPFIFLKEGPIRSLNCFNNYLSIIGPSNCVSLYDYRNRKVVNKIFLGSNTRGYSSFLDSNGLYIGTNDGAYFISTSCNNQEYTAELALPVTNSRVIAINKIGDNKLGALISGQQCGILPMNDNYQVRKLQEEGTLMYDEPLVDASPCEIHKDLIQVEQRKEKEVSRRIFNIFTQQESSSLLSIDQHNLNYLIQEFYTLHVHADSVSIELEQSKLDCLVLPVGCINTNILCNKETKLVHVGLEFFKSLLGMVSCLSIAVDPSKLACQQSSESPKVLLTHEDYHYLVKPVVAGKKTLNRYNAIVLSILLQARDKFVPAVGTLRAAHYQSLHELHQWIKDHKKQLVQEGSFLCNGYALDSSLSLGIIHKRYWKRDRTLVLVYKTLQLINFGSDDRGDVYCDGIENSEGVVDVVCCNVANDTLVQRRKLNPVIPLEFKAKEKNRKHDKDNEEANADRNRPLVFIAFPFSINGRLSVEAETFLNDLKTMVQEKTMK